MYTGKIYINNTPVLARHLALIHGATWQEKADNLIQFAGYYRRRKPQSEILKRRLNIIIKMLDKLGV